MGACQECAWFKFICSLGPRTHMSANRGSKGIQVQRKEGRFARAAARGGAFRDAACAQLPPLLLSACEPECVSEVAEWVGGSVYVCVCGGGAAAELQRRPGNGDGSEVCPGAERRANKQTRGEEKETSADEGSAAGPRRGACAGCPLG